MNKIAILLITCMLGIFTAAHAQTLEDYVEETRGDTLVILSTNDLGAANSLIDAMEADVDAPATRVYELKRGHSYLQDRGPYATPSDRPTVIVGAEAGPIVGGTADDGRPPLIAGTVDAEGNPTNFNFMALNADFVLKNVALQGGAADGSEGWFPLEMTSDNIKVVMDNMLMEHNNWTFIQSNNAADNSLTITNSYMLNMTGVATRRNGGVYDAENQKLQKLHVENNTHLQAAGMIYKFRNHAADTVLINRNTFVNAAGQLFLSFGYEHNMAVTNNLFVNSNVQGYYPGLDYNETNQYLPHGIINLNHFPADTSIVDDAERKVLVDRNGVYWDPRLDQIVETLNAENVECPADEGESDCQPGEEWMSQMITMNSRTQEMFNDDERYPLLTEGNWVMEGDPEFTDHGGLMTDAVDDVIEWSINTAGPGNDQLMRKWRSEGNEAETGEAENFLNFDWPVAADLSYSNAAYLTAGLGGFPLGDINWYPDQKADWEAQRDAEYAEIFAALNEGRIPTSNESSTDIPQGIKLDQNFPNPFNPSTQISFTLPQAQEVSLVVYDMLGRQVATLASREQFASGQNTVSFDASNLSSGIYLYRLTSADVTLTKKMTLIK